MLFSDRYFQIILLERTGEISFKWLIFLAVLPRAVFRTQSKVYGGAFLQK